MKDQNTISKKFIESSEYHDLMFKHINGDTDMYNLAEDSENFRYRAHELKNLGAWRWMSVYQYRHLISKYVFSNQKGIDFGGFKGPIYGNSVIVDIADGSEYKDLLEFKDNSQDYIFSSHTLEHISLFDIHLVQMYYILKKNGKLMLILPAYTCKRWNPMGIDKGHLWNFILSYDENIEKFQQEREYRAYYKEYYRIIDKIIEDIGFKIWIKKYCWDNSICIYAEK